MQRLFRLVTLAGSERILCSSVFVHGQLIKLAKLTSEDLDGIMGEAIRTLVAEDVDVDEILSRSPFAGMWGLQPGAKKKKALTPEEETQAAIAKLSEFVSLDEFGQLVFLASRQKLLAHSIHCLFRHSPYKYKTGAGKSPRK